MKTKNIIISLLFILSLGYTIIFNIFLFDYATIHFDLTYSNINLFLAQPILTFTFTYLLINILENTNLSKIFLLVSLVPAVLYILAFPAGMILGSTNFILDFFTFIIQYRLTYYIYIFFGVSLYFSLKK